MRRRVDEAPRVAGPNDHAGHAVVEVQLRGAAVVGHHDEPARHGLEDHVAERLRLAGKEKDVGGGVVCGEVVARSKASNDQIAMVPLEGRSQRPVADHDETETAVHVLHGPVRLDGKPDVLLRRQAPDGQDHQVALRRAPGRREGPRAARRVEAAAVYAAAEHAEVPEPGGHELVAERRRRHEGSGGGIVEATQEREDRAPQPARAVVLDVAMEVGVEAGVHGDPERAAGSHRRPPQRPFGRDVDDVGIAESPGGP
jgi:hypothetical protein